MDEKFEIDIKKHFDRMAREYFYIYRSCGLSVEESLRKLKHFSLSLWDFVPNNYNPTNKAFQSLKSDERP